MRGNRDSNYICFRPIDRLIGDRSSQATQSGGILEPIPAARHTHVMGISTINKPSRLIAPVPDTLSYPSCTPVHLATTPEDRTDNTHRKVAPGSDSWPTSVVSPTNSRVRRALKLTAPRGPGHPYPWTRTLLSHAHIQGTPIAKTSPTPLDLLSFPFLTALINCKAAPCLWCACTYGCCHGVLPVVACFRTSLFVYLARLLVTTKVSANGLVLSTPHTHLVGHSRWSVAPTVRLKKPSVGWRSKICASHVALLVRAREVRPTWQLMHLVHGQFPSLH